MATHCMTFGLTVEQIDRLHRLIGTIMAHGDLIAVCAGAPLAQHSLPTLGEVIFDAGQVVSDILAQVDGQRLDATLARGAARR